MKILGVSGSTRKDSSNTQLLDFLSQVAPAGVDVSVFRGLGSLPIFCSDLEGDRTPKLVEDFCAEVRAADGIVFSSPEYVHAIPGGLKNAIDWLVSRDEVIGKPMALLHASHRGDDVLRSLRLILTTISDQFQEDNFLQIPLMSKSRTEIAKILNQEENRSNIQIFLSRFLCFMGEGGPPTPS